MVQKLIKQGELGQQGKASELAKGELKLDAKITGKLDANAKALIKDLKLDGTDANSKKFIKDLSSKLAKIKPGEGQTGKLSDSLKGLDPKQIRTIETFLGKGQSGKAGDLTISQIDSGRLNTLRNILNGGKGATTLDARNININSLGKLYQGNGLILEQPTAKDFGQNLKVLGKQLNSGNLLATDGKGTVRLTDLASKSVDGKAANILASTAGSDFILRMNGPQELAINRLIENSIKLANLVETGKVNLTRTGDGSNNIVGDLIARNPAGMNGVSFVVRGEIIGTSMISDIGQGVIKGNLGAGAQASELMNVITRADGSQVLVSPLEVLSGKPIDPVTGLPYDPFTGKLLDPTTGRVIGNVRPGEQGGKGSSSRSEGSKRDLEDKNLELEEEAKNKKKALLLMTHARKLREQKEREIREKKLREQKLKKEDKKRTKYVVKSGDTLESIAQKQLRDIRMSALIYNINKNIIPIIQEGGKPVVNLTRGLVLWLPSPFEQREFRGNVLSGKVKPGTATAPASGGKTYATPEEELAAKFGENWSGNDTNADTASGVDSESAAAIQSQLLESAMKVSDERRKNIESVLGPFEKKEAVAATTASEIKYTVRLGDTLKSVAMKHPLVRDITLWKLIAEKNKLSTATDKKGTPKARLKRGTDIKIPNREEIQAYREKLGLTKAFSPDVARTQNSDASIDLHLCDNCGRMSAKTAPVCACGHRISEKSKKKKQKDLPPYKSGVPTQIDNPEAALDLQEANRGNKTPKKTKVGESVKTEIDTKTPQTLSKAKPQPAPEKDHLEVVEELDTMTRLAKQNPEGQKPLAYILQVQHDGQWQSLLSYEIGNSKTYRHDDFSGPRRKSVKIDLPARAAEELAKNDLNSNWKNYKRKFLRTQS